MADFLSLRDMIAGSKRRKLKGEADPDDDIESTSVIGDKKTVD